MESLITEMSHNISQSRFASYASLPVVAGVEYESILQEASLDYGVFMTSPDWPGHPDMAALHIQPRHKRVSPQATAAPAEESGPETQTIADQNYVFGEGSRFDMTPNVNRAAYLSPEGEVDNGHHHKEPKLSQSDMSVFESPMSPTVEQSHIEDSGMEVHPELDSTNPVIVQSSKRKRGRPRLISQHSRAERRRAQIRDAQRTYRERKEQTIADLKAQISKLQSAIDSMRLAFFELYNEGRRVAIHHRDLDFVETLTNVTVKILEVSKEVDVGMEDAHLNLQEDPYKELHVKMGQSSNPNSSSPEVDPIENDSEFSNLVMRLSEYFKLLSPLQRREPFH
ncbi:hypothetical protein V1509DRAFT_635631 [Lipomyces kononenkoae]